MNLERILSNGNEMKLNVNSRVNLYTCDVVYVKLCYVIASMFQMFLMMTQNAIKIPNFSTVLE